MESTSPSLLKELLTQTLPNWIMALAAAWGVFEIIRGYFKLRQQQKENEQKMSNFNDQLNEFRKQTTQFEYQTTLMSENNKILEKGIKDLVTNLVQSWETEMQGLEIERLRRISEIRPFFVFHRGTSNPNGFVINLSNDGGTATSLRIIDVSTGAFSIQPFKKNLIIQKGQTIEIIGFPNNKVNANLSSGQILIGFIDADGNQYQQNIVKDSNKYSVGLPIKIEN